MYETADCCEVALDFALTCIEFMGDVTAGRIILGDAGVEFLLWVAALEFAGIKMDPVNQGLPALRLKRVARTSENAFSPI